MMPGDHDVLESQLRHEAKRLRPENTGGLRRRFIASLESESRSTSRTHCQNLQSLRTRWRPTPRSAAAAIVLVAGLSLVILNGRHRGTSEALLPDLSTGPVVLRGFSMPAPSPASTSMGQRAFGWPLDRPDLMELASDAASFELLLPSSPFGLQ